MKSLVATGLAVLMVAAAAMCGCRGESTIDQRSAAIDPTVVGQLLLPRGSGSRGVEVLVEVEPHDGVPQTVWVLFDEQGRFSRTFRATPTRIKVTAGGREIHRIDPGDMPGVNLSGEIDLGSIDLRERLVRHRLVVRAADDSPPDTVRVAMWFGPPPVGPEGEPVSLGSRQFPPVALGSELEWLLPHEAQEVYFLVERPAGPGRGTEWRSGQQSLFGPFSSTDLPKDLVVEPRVSASPIRSPSTSP